MSWKLAYNDGSANGYRFDAAGDGATYRYKPVRPEESSTGMYSGGDPREGALDATTVATLWQHVRALEQATQHHVEARAKGTGQFWIDDERGERGFIYAMSDELSAFDAFLRALPG